MATPHLIWKKSCDTCRRFKAALEAEGVVFTDREINAQPLSADEVAGLLGERPVKDFLNPRNEVYRERGLARTPPDRETAVALIAAHNNLLRRPVFIAGDVVLTGNDLPAALAALGR